MCGRTSVAIDPARLSERFAVTVDDRYEPRYNVAPGGPHPAVLNAQADRLSLPIWGYQPESTSTTGRDQSSQPTAQATPTPTPPTTNTSTASTTRTARPLINARAETVAEKPSFRESFRRRRCLVVVDGFYEWKGLPGGGSQPYHVRRPDGSPFAMAGIWRRRGAEGRPTMAVLTTSADDTLAPIHDRMPVVLSEPVESTWLHGDADRATGVLDTVPDTDLEAYPVSTAVNDPAVDHDGLKEPVDGIEQPSLDEFGS